MSRWVPLYATTNSGKTLFVCLMCGRISTTPDKTCPEPPTVVSWKMTATCAVLEEIEDAAFTAGEHHTRLKERIMMVGVAADGTALAQWQQGSGDWHSAKVEIREEKSKRTAKTKPAGHRFERTPDGDINNCALAAGYTEDTCQICKGHCPDRNRFNEHTDE